MPWRQKSPLLSCRLGRQVAVPPKSTLAASQHIYSKAEFFLFGIGKQRRLKKKFAAESWYRDYFPTNICSSQPHLDVESEAGEAIFGSGWRSTRVWHRSFPTYLRIQSKVCESLYHSEWNAVGVCQGRHNIAIVVVLFFPCDILFILQCFFTRHRSFGHTEPFNPKQRYNSQGWQFYAQIKNLINYILIKNIKLIILLKEYLEKKILKFYRIKKNTSWNINVLYTS